MSNKEAQEEELEVLKSIYEGDTEFKTVDDHTFQYKFGDEGEKLTVLIEIQWPTKYPEVAPDISLNAFYNNHLSTSAKSVLAAALKEEAGNNVGSQQTYTLIEWTRENLEGVVTPYLSENALSSRMDNLSMDKSNTDEGGKSKVKKEQLTKSQKRKEWNRVDASGEKPRGYDWVDIVKHLSQTGGSKSEFLEQASQSSTANNYLASSDLPN